MTTLTAEVGIVPHCGKPSEDVAPKLKILMLHGFTQSGPLFRAKTRALEKALSKAIPAAPAPAHLPAYPGGVEVVYPTGPIRLEPTSVPGYTPPTVQTDELAADPNVAQQDIDTDAWAWWRKDEESGEYVGLDKGLAAMAEVLKLQGPFAGVIGFSQGAAAAAMLASLLEPPRLKALNERHNSPAAAGIPYPASFLADPHRLEPTIFHPPLNFAVAYSGFPALHPLYAALYDPPISTPLLHVIGTLDTVVDESRSLRLVDACGLDKELKAERVIYHPGGHFLPCQKQYVNALVGFIRQTVSNRHDRSSRDAKQVGSSTV